MQNFFLRSAIWLYMRVCWNRQTGTFEGRVSLTYGFKSHYSHQSSKLKNAYCFFIQVLCGCKITIQQCMRVCWNRQTGTFEGRVSLTYGFKSHYSHQGSELKRLAAFLFIAVFTCYALLSICIAHGFSAIFIIKPREMLNNRFVTFPKIRI